MTISWVLVYQMISLGNNYLIPVLVIGEFYSKFLKILPKSEQLLVKISPYWLLFG